MLSLFLLLEIEEARLMLLQIASMFSSSKLEFMKELVN
jgi:hypothetical protein